MVAMVTGSGALAAAPAWENGGRALEVSDLPSVVVGASPMPADGSPPLPPEPGAPEDIGLTVEADTGGDAITGPAPSLGERLQEFVPSTPDMLSFDSAVAIEPDGSVVPCSTKRGIWDCLECVGDACWVARFEAIALWRNAPASRPLFTTVDPVTATTGPTAFNASQLQSDPLAAPRLTLARLDECGRGFDASYLYAGNFFSQRSLPTAADGYAFSAPGIYGNPSGLAGSPVSSAQQRLTASLQTAEINYREPLGWGSTRFLTGFRWLQWRENWSMVDQPSTGSESWQTGCFNDLYGGQIGLDSMLWNSGKGMRLEGLVKAGAYYNAASQSSSSSLTPASITVDSPAGSAFVGEVGLTSVLPLRKNLDLRCGYFGLWLQGLAQPTRQLSGQTLTPATPATGTLSTNGGVVLQGVSLGLEGRW
ncbi:MAG: hypothetical protein ACKOWG_20010 [Planctomycetia bacterium]